MSARGVTFKPNGVVKIREAPADLKEVPTPQEAAVSQTPSSSTRAMFAKITPVVATAVVPEKVPAVAPKVPKVSVAPVPVVAKEPAAPVPAVAKEPKVPKAPPAVITEGEKVAKITAIQDPMLHALAEGFMLEELEDPYENPAPQAYVPESRRGFANFIKMTYDDFILPPPGESEPLKPGDKYPYQKFIREYMRQASPYRGILVYHGLGSGKTCSAIAASEALFASANKKVIVMTPFSLRKNFLKEVSFCGFRHFRLSNHWVSLEKERPIHRSFALDILGLTEGYLRTAKKIWVPDFAQPEPNYESLPSDEQTEIRKQIISQLVWDAEKNPGGRIRFINYNGISAKKLKKLACDTPEFFNDAVIVVDEIHNLIRLMQGEIDPYLKDLPGKKRKMARETVMPGDWKPSLCGKDTNYRRGYLFYRLFLAARRSKIIGLSGTPLINFPEELGILANILHGYTPIVKATIQEVGDAAQAAVEAAVNAHPNVDYVGVDRGKEQMAGTELTVTLLGEGLQKSKVLLEGKITGVERIPRGQPIPTADEIKASLVESIKNAGFKIRGEVTLEAAPLLHPFGEEFHADFLSADGLEVKNKFVLGKRLTGLISYYKGSRQDLMPAVASDEVIRVPFSSFSQGAYSKVRLDEIEIELKKKDKTEGGLGAVWGEVYEIGKMQKSSNYRMGSRQMCNFAFPTTITRPRARNSDEEDMENVEDNEILETSPDLPSDSPAEAAAYDFPELDNAPEEGVEELEEVASEYENKKRIYLALKRVFAKLVEDGLHIDDIRDRMEGQRQYFKIPIPLTVEELASLDNEFETLRFTPDGFSGVEGEAFSEDLAKLTGGFATPPVSPKPEPVVTPPLPSDEEAVTPVTPPQEGGAGSDDEEDSKPKAPAEPKKIKLKDIRAKQREDAAAAAAAAPAPAPKKISLKEIQAKQREAKAQAAKPKNENMNDLVALFENPAKAVAAPKAKEAREENMKYMEAFAEKPKKEPTAPVSKTAPAASAAKQPRCKGPRQEGETYKQAILRAKDCLRRLAFSSLKLNPAVGEDGESLAKYSPKFAAILQRIMDAPGSSLVYSQFLDMEGIGIFRIVMDINDFAPIEIINTPEGPAFSGETEASLRKGPGGQMRYITFSGEEKEEVRRYALDVFNARFGELPGKLKTVLQESGFTDNHTGQLCRVFCITSAGAEGLSLKNVRAVHIMEPYWNDVRLKQVKGRAIRIGSHLELPEDQRNVSIYTYISVFGPETQTSKDKETKIDETIKNRDNVDRAMALKVGLPIPATAASYVMTSDERLFVISERKKKVIEELETVMKGAAVDCQLNAAENQDGTFQCLSLNKMVGDFVYEPELKADIAKSEYTFKEEKRLVKAIKWKGVEYWAGADKDAGGKIIGFTLYAKADQILSVALGTAGAKDDRPAEPVVIF